MANVHAQALLIVQTLQSAGFDAFFAGGWVRDHLLGRKSQDIDIATSAHPEDVMALFPKSIAVGAQFGVVRVRQNSHEFEVATFRSDEQYVDGRRPKSVRYSSPREDALRRDFTINGMFYDPMSDALYDYVGGKEDIDRKLLRAIGNPVERFQEDRLRIIRTIRFKNTLKFFVDPATWEALCQEAHHVLSAVSPERVWQELQKMFAKGVLAACLVDFQRCGLLSYMFPSLTALSHERVDERISFVARYTAAHYMGKNLVAALCVLVQDPEALCACADAYRLSRSERRIISTFLRLQEFCQKRAHTTEAFVRMYALPDSMLCLQAISVFRSQPVRFMRTHEKREQELHFWIEQLRTKKFMVTGADAAAYGIAPGVEMGKFLEKTFALSVQHRVKNKQQLLQLLKKS